jgi:hypothetical protein
MMKRRSNEKRVNNVNGISGGRRRRKKGNGRRRLGFFYSMVVGYVKRNTISAF